MLPNWTFPQRLVAGFALVVGLMVIMAVIAFVSLRSAVDSYEAILDREAANLVDAQAVFGAMEQKVAGVRGFLLTGDEQHVAGVGAADDALLEATARIKARQGDDEGLAVTAAIERSAAEHQREVDEILALARSGAPLAVTIAQFDERVVPAFEIVKTRGQELVDRQGIVMADARDSATASAGNAELIVIGIGIAGAIVATAVALLITRGLTTQVGASVQDVRSSTSELQATASQQASGAREQATAMTEITTTMSELLTTASQIAESAQRVAAVAQDTAEGASDGDEAVANAQEAIVRIREQVDAVVQHMLDLGQRSQKIGEVLALIDELAEQTNILAINAMIEAAGAGEAGQRFAVVGEEIRNLADRVADSTKQISSLIEEIRAAVNASVMATETGSKTVDAGAERFAEVAVAFSRIASLVETTTEAAREIELSTKQQQTAVEQVNAAIADVAQAAEENEASSTQTLQTASQLASLSNNLAQMVRRQSLDTAA